METRFSSYLNDKNLCVYFPRFKFRFKKKNDIENTIRNWILHLLSSDDKEAYSGYTCSSSAEGQEDQSERKTVSLSSLMN